MTRREAWVLLLLIAVYTLTYSGVFHSDDEMSVAAAAESLVKRGGLAIDQLRWNQDLSAGIGKYGLDGHLYSKYGWGASVALAPLYLAARLLPPLGNAQAANLLNIFVTALTAVLVMRCARQLGTGEGTATALALLFGLATMAWPYAKYLFGEPLTGLLLLAAFHELLAHRDSRSAVRLLSAGLVLAAALAVKTANAAAIPVFAVQLAFYEWEGGRGGTAAYLRRLVTAGLVMAAPVVMAGTITLAYNWVRFGDILDAGYLAIERFSGRLDQGLPGLLLSPGRGLIFYVPLVWLLLPALPAFWRRHRIETLVILLLAASQTLLYARWHVWFGGWCWGPRFLVPLMPFLVLALGPWLENVWQQPGAGRMRLAVGLVAAASVAVQVLGLGIDYNLYLSNLLAQHPELRAGIAYLTVDDPAYSPLLGQLGLLRIENLDMAWLRVGQAGAWVDWRILVPALIFLAATLALPRLWNHRQSRRAGTVLALALGGIALWQAAAWGSGVDSYGAVAADYQAIFDRIGAEARPGDTLLFVAPDRSDILLNANKQALPTYAPAQEKWPLKSSTVAMLEGVAAKGGRLWLVTEDVADAGSGFEHWLGLNAHWVSAQERGPALVTLYALPPAAPTSPAQPVGRAFGGSIRLDGYTISPWPAHPGREVLITLYWQSLAAPQMDYRVSLRLADPSGAQVYQRDADPGDGYLPTSAWRTDQTVLDRRGLALPASASPGAYTLTLVLYDPATSQVLPLDDGSQSLSFGLLAER